MRKRKPIDDESGSMDSLLDTMTNVVGILVIVLVVTQLGVGDAVQRISESIEVDPEQLKTKQARLEEIDHQQVLLQAQIELLKQSEDPDQDQLAEQVQALRKKLDQDALVLKNLRLNLLADEESMAKGKKEQEAEKKRREELEQQIVSSLAEMAKLRATLEKTPDREVLPANIIKLPDPRPAPAGLSPILLICYENKLYPLNWNEIQLAARARADQILATKRVRVDGVIDPEKFVAEFSRKLFRNEFFDIEMKAAPNGRPRLVLHPRERAGATAQQVARKTSKFNQDLRRLDPTKKYIRFFVCGESYDIYLTARARVEEHKLFVGWIPQPTGWKFAGDMGGPIHLGPKPKPNPNAPVRPPPKKPTDEID